MKELPKEGLGEAYGAYETTDDRGSLGGCLGWFSSEHDADNAAAKKGWYGGQGATRRRDTITVKGETYVLLSSNPIDLNGKKEEVEKNLRESALKKLTDAEKSALGI